MNIRTEPPGIHIPGDRGDSLFIVETPKHRRMTLEYRADFETIPWQSALSGMRYRVCEQDGGRLRVVEYSSNFVEPDWCRNGHVGYVLEGEFEIDFNGRLVRFGAGDGIFIPPGEDHKHMPRILSEIVRVVLFEDA